MTVFLFDSLSLPAQERSSNLYDMIKIDKNAVARMSGLQAEKRHHVTRGASVGQDN